MAKDDDPPLPPKPSRPAHLAPPIPERPSQAVRDILLRRAPGGQGSAGSESNAVVSQSEHAESQIEAKQDNSNAVKGGPEALPASKSTPRVSEMMQSAPHAKEPEGTRFIYIPFTPNEMGDKDESGNLLDMAEEYLNEFLPDYNERRINEGKPPHNVVLCVEGSAEYEANMEALKGAGENDVVYVLAHGSNVPQKVLSTEYEATSEVTAEECKSEKNKKAPSNAVALSPKGLAIKMESRVGKNVGKIKLLCCGSGNNGEDLVLQGLQKLSPEGIRLVQETKQQNEINRAQDPKHGSHSFAHHFNQQLEERQIFPKAEVRGYEGYLTFGDNDKFKSKASLLKTIDQGGDKVSESFSRAKDRAVKFPAGNRQVKVMEF